jgi:hypothetical protein
MTITSVHSQWIPRISVLSSISSNPCFWFTCRGGQSLNRWAGLQSNGNFSSTFSMPKVPLFIYFNLFILFNIYLINFFLYSFSFWYPSFFSFPPIHYSRSVAYLRLRWQSIIFRSIRTRVSTCPEKPIARAGEMYVSFIQLMQCSCDWVNSGFRNLFYESAIVSFGLSIGDSPGYTTARQWRGCW